MIKMMDDGSSDEKTDLGEDFGLTLLVLVAKEWIAE